jgi:hypothetical protein
MLVKEIFAPYTDNHKKATKALLVEAGGTCSYHWALKGQ